jgi:hypothetical protein
MQGTQNLQEELAEMSIQLESRYLLSFSKGELPNSYYTENFHLFNRSKPKTESFRLSDRRSLDS